ncbi:MULTISPECIES: hypothetical protein [unclassified Leucobacter]|uniref:hypothetical protein n=1 Tax=unclassified Leucobacter TaxID=2621730 RepID=UPI000A7EF4F5|nr:hypothetical protein [Leucobacter sp. Ag1]
MAKRTCKTCGKRFTGDGRRRYCSAECRGEKPKTAPVLRAVEPDETPPADPGPPKPRQMELIDAYEDGTPLEQALAHRRHLVQLMKEAGPRDAAAISRQVRDISREITALESQAEEEADDAANTPDEEWDEDAI